MESNQWLRRHNHEMNDRMHILIRAESESVNAVLRNELTLAMEQMNAKRALIREAIPEMRLKKAATKAMAAQIRAAFATNRECEMNVGSD